jgi:hypothetical protein
VRQPRILAGRSPPSELASVPLRRQQSTDKIRTSGGRLWPGVRCCRDR